MLDKLRNFWNNMHPNEKFIIEGFRDIAMVLVVGYIGYWLLVTPALWLIDKIR